MLGGVKARLFRISFSGEHAYELAVPADYGNAVARAVMQAGKEFGVVPYGVEALSIMRIEKGHVAGGELNGTTTAADLGLGKMMSTKKDYIGRMMATREGLVDPARQCVVGIKPVDRFDENQVRRPFAEAGRCAFDGRRSGVYLFSRLLAHAEYVARSGAVLQWARASWRNRESV